MIVGIEGIPGSGKSYEAVAYHVLPALKSGRKVITNLPLNLEAFSAIDPEYPDLIEIKNRPSPTIGKWDASNIAAESAFQPFDDGHVEPVAESVFTFGTVWDYYDDWRDQDGRGPLYVIDECHVSLPKLGTSAAVVEWFKLHRHYNVDVVLLTQSFRDINQPIALLLATLIKCRKADILGKADHYIRKVHAGYRGAVIQTGQRVYKKQYFGLYKSHTQGVSLSEEEARDVSPMIVKFNRVKWAVMGLAVASLIWAFWPKPGTNVFGAKTKPAAAAPVPVVQAPKPVASVVQPVSVPASAASAPELPASAPEPIKRTGEFGVLADKQISVVGMLSSAEAELIVFVVSDGGRRLFDITSDELERAGYRIKLFGYCFGWLEYVDTGVKHSVVCDAPELGQGTENRPIVYESSAGRWSNESRRARFSGDGIPVDVDVPSLPPAQPAAPVPAASEPPIQRLRPPTGIRPPTGLRPQTPIR